MKPTSLDVRCRSPKRLYHHCTRHVRFQRHWKVLKRLKRCLEPHFSRYVSAGAGFIVVSLGETLLTLLHSFQIPYLLNSAVFRKSLLSDFVLTCICTARTSPLCLAFPSNLHTTRSIWTSPRILQESWVCPECLRMVSSFDIMESRGVTWSNMARCWKRINVLKSVAQSHLANSGCLKRLKLA